MAHGVALPVLARRSVDGVEVAEEVGVGEKPVAKAQLRGFPVASGPAAHFLVNVGHVPPT